MIYENIPVTHCLCVAVQSELLELDGEWHHLMVQFSLLPRKATVCCYGNVDCMILSIVSWFYLYLWTVGFVVHWYVNVDRMILSKVLVLVYGMSKEL